MTSALERARADLAAGRAWLARDRLTGLLDHRQDDEVLALLVEVHLAMGDLPKAGALLVLLGGEGPEVDAALAAWRHRYGDPEARWRSIPAPVRVARGPELAALRVAEADRPPGERDLPPDHVEGGEGPGVGAALGCLLALAGVLAVLALALVGAATLLRSL